MKKTFKKALAATMASAMVVAGVGILPAATANAADDAVAHLSINNDAWSEYEATYVDATITGDGQYTVSMTATEGQSLVQFNALQVANGEALMGTACVLTVDSIKINGEDVELTGKSYTCSADGAGVDTRVNLYNEWNAPDDTAVAGDDSHLDQRCAEGSVMDCSACLFDSSYCNASSGSGFLVESIEVTFTVSNFGVNAEGGASVAADTADVEGPAIAHLSINNDAWSEYEAEYVDAEITGDGTYTVSMTATEGQSLVQFNALQVANGEILMGNACVLTVDSIKINGEDVEMTGKSYTCSADGAGVDTRVNLYNEWNAPDDTATAGDDNHLDQRCAEGSVMDCSACLFDSSYCNASSGSGFLVQSIEVTFTVSNFGVSSGAGEEEEEITAPNYDIITEFPANITNYDRADYYFPDATYTVQNDVMTVTMNIEYLHTGEEDGGFNDWCANGVVVTTSDGTEKYYAFGGAQATWDISIKGPETAEIVGGANNADNKFTVLDADGKGSISFLVDKGTTIDIYALGWETFDGDLFTVSFEGDEAPAADTTAAADTTSSTTSTETVSEKKGGLSTGGIVGIIAGVVVLGGAGAAIGVTQSKKKNK